MTLDPTHQALGRKDGAICLVLGLPRDETLQVRDARVAELLARYRRRGLA